VPAPKRALRWVHRLLGFTIALAAAFYPSAALGVIALRWGNPPVTAVQAERHMGSWIHRTPYHKRYTFVPLNRISANFQHRRRR